MRFLSTFGRLPGTWLNLLVIVLSGMAEGIGLTLFIPLLHVMSGANLADLPPPFSLLVNAFERLGLGLTLMTLLALIAALVLGALAMAYQQKKMLVRASQRFVRDFRNSLFGGFLKANWGNSSQLSHGEVVNQLTTECQRAGLALSFELLGVATVIQIALYAAFSMVISWQLLILAVGFGVLTLLVVLPLTRRAKVLGGLTNEANRDLSFFGLEYLRSLKLLKAMSSEESAARNMSEKTDNLSSINFMAEMNMTQVYFITQALPVVIFTVVIGFSHEVLKTPVSLILVFLLFMARIAPRVAQLQQQIQGYNLHSPAISAIDDVIERNRAQVERLNRNGMTFQRVADSIVLERVSYTYPGSQAPTVEDVSLVIPRNTMVAFVGGSGAGKSTLLDILIGLRLPDAGRVAVDGVDLGEFDLVSWRRRIGIVPQEATVFNASLDNNLRFFHPEATDEDVARALAIAHLDNVVEVLPYGLDTLLGENGVRLSGGERQRVALARALVGRPEILMLDEATSALDNESERYVQDAIGRIANTLTIIVIAHRLSTVRRADMIYVVENGHVIESGSYAELMAKGGRFAELKELELT